jgi:hypothetical protein
MFTVVQVSTDYVVVVDANLFFDAINLTDQVVNRDGINLGIVLSREVQVGKLNSSWLFQYVDFDFQGSGIIKSQGTVEVRTLQALDSSTCHKVAQGLQLRRAEHRFRFLFSELREKISPYFTVSEILPFGSTSRTRS